MVDPRRTVPTPKPTVMSNVYCHECSKAARADIKHNYPTCAGQHYERPQHYIRTREARATKEIGDAREWRVVTFTVYMEECWRGKYNANDPKERHVISAPSEIEGGWSGYIQKTPAHTEAFYTAFTAAIKEDQDGQSQRTLGHMIRQRSPHAYEVINRLRPPILSKPIALPDVAGLLDRFDILLEISKGMGERAQRAYWIAFRQDQDEASEW